MAKRKDIKSMYGMIKEMYLSGMEAIDIVQEIGVSRCSVYRALAIMGIPIRKTRVERMKDDEENLTYADNRFPKLEKVVINGKRYVDITPIFSPR